MDRDKDAKLTFDEFVEGSKQDPTIVQVRTSEKFAQSVLNLNPIGSVTIRWSGVVIGVDLVVIGEPSHPRAPNTD
jgi:hypothetical protein